MSRSRPRARQPIVGDLQWKFSGTDNRAARRRNISGRVVTDPIKRTGPVTLMLEPTLQVCRHPSPRRSLRRRATSEFSKPVGCRIGVSIRQLPLQGEVPPGRSMIGYFLFTRRARCLPTPKIPASPIIPTSAAAARAFAGMRIRASDILEMLANGVTRHRY